MTRTRRGARTARRYSSDQLGGTARRYSSSCRAGGSACATTGCTQRISIRATTHRRCRMPNTVPATQLMVDFSPSEFSRFRLQLAHDESTVNECARQVFLQYIHSLGTARRAQVLTGEKDGEEKYEPHTVVRGRHRAALAHRRRPSPHSTFFACEPEWGALAKELAGDKASIYTATTALQDPHRIEARPSLIARARSADLAVCTGAELEVGWLPLVQTQSGNPKIQAGRPGMFEAARFVTMLEVPRELDRAQGDVHPAGNPHVHLDPRNIAKVAAALAERMVELDPGEAAHYRSRAQAFLQRWQEATARWEKAGAPLKGMPIVVYHKNMTLPRELARLARGRLPRAQAGPAADRVALERAPRGALAGAGQRRSCVPPTTIRARRNGCPNARRFQPSPLPFHGRRQRESTGLVRALRRHPGAPAGCSQMNLAAIDPGILGPAFAAGLLVTATHAPLGIQVLRRGIVFIDLAIAQVAGLGVILADSMGLEPQGWGVQIAALVAAFAGALLLTWTEKLLARGSGSHHRHRLHPGRERRPCCSSRPILTAASTSRNCWSGRSCG